LASALRTTEKDCNEFILFNICYYKRKCDYAFYYVHSRTNASKL
jgi:hypothetical protein